MRTIRALFTLIAVLGVVACGDASPVISATLDGHELPAQQVEALAGWLHAQESGWARNFATPPVPSHVITVRQKSGEVRSIDLFDKKGWSSAVVSEGHIKVFPSPELANLRQLLGLGR